MVIDSPRDAAAQRKGRTLIFAHQKNALDQHWVALDGLSASEIAVEQLFSTANHVDLPMKN
jgi:hypothetical protein